MGGVKDNASSLFLKAVTFIYIFSVEVFQPYIHLFAVYSMMCPIGPFDFSNLLSHEKSKPNAG